MEASLSLSLPEQAVLAILSQQPAHGFAVVQLTAPGGELGRIWHIPKAVVYRAIGRLADAGLITPEGTEPGLGPQRTVYTATPQGQQAVRDWLDTPVRHIRDIRSHLLLKLALLDRAGADPTGLLQRQRAVLEPIARAIEARQPSCSGFDATLLAWRRATAVSALDFLNAITSVSLSIGGEVERPACLALAELRALMDAELVADFHCHEGWSRLGERWRGVRLQTLLALAGADGAAGYVTVGSGEYTAVLSREQAEDERVLLALEHEGAASPRRAGFPRLVGPAEWDCFLSVKSVDRIEVTREPQQATAATIALARLEREAASIPAAASRRDM